MKRSERRTLDSPMPSKRDVLALLTRDELLATADRFELTVSDRRVREQIFEAVAPSKRAGLADALAPLSRDRLKEVCRSPERAEAVPTRNERVRGLAGSLTRTRLVRVAAAVVIGLFFCRTGAAQSPSDGAKEHYRLGTAAYNLGKYAEAAQEYELSYRATLDPALLFNVAQAYRLAGDRKKALTAYKSYLRSAPDGEKRELAEAKVHEIEAALNYDDPFSGGSVGPTSKPEKAPATAPEPSPQRHPPIMEAPPPESSVRGANHGPF